MGKCIKSLQKIFKKMKLNATSHNTTSWYTDTDGFLEHSPSGGILCYKGPALQKILPVVFWVPLCIPYKITLFKIKWIQFLTGNISPLPLSSGIIFIFPNKITAKDAANTWKFCYTSLFTNVLFQTFLE